MSETRSRHEPDPARQLRDHVSDILAEAEAPPEARRTLEIVVHALADAVAQPDESALIAVESAASLHALERFDNDAGFGRTLRELQALRKAIVHRLPDEARLPELLDEVASVAADTDWGVRRRILFALDRITAAATEASDERDLLDRLLRILTEGGEVDTASVLLRHGDALIPEAAVNLDEEVRQRIEVPVGVGFAGRVAAERAPLLLTEASSHPLIYSEALRQRGVQTLYGVPLLHDGELLGVAHIGSLRPELSQSSRILLRAIADRAATAIAARRLRLAEEDARRRLAALIESLPVGVAVADETGRLLERNGTLARIWGADPSRSGLDDLTQYTAWRADTGQRVTPDSWTIVRAARGEPIEADVFDIERFDGLHRTIVSSARPVYHDDRIIGAVAVIQDVTGLRRAEQRQRLLAASDVLSGGQDVTDRLRGLAEVVVPQIADRCVVYLCGDDGALTRAASSPAESLDVPEASHVVEGGRSLLLDGEGHCVGGACHALVPLVARDQVLGVLALAMDTRRRGYDEADLAVFEELGRRAGVAIDNARLFSALQEAVSVREDVLAVVSHDLRNPLSVISLTATYLARVTDPERIVKLAPEALQRIVSATRRMDRLIGTLLDFGRLRAGTLELAVEEVAPAELLDAVAESARILASDSGADIELVPTSAPPVRCDRDRILQVLTNLTDNAVKFTPSGGHITIAAAQEDGEVVFRVTDTGPGLSPDDRERVFERYYRAAGSPRVGTGLGLSIAADLVARHGGRIWVDSEPGRGSTFAFTLPVASARPGQAAAGR